MNYALHGSKGLTLPDKPEKRSDPWSKGAIMIQTFLSRILPVLAPAGDFGPSETYYSLALGNDKYRRQDTCPDTKTLKSYCDIYSQYGHNAYMALASFNITGGRKQTNAVAARAIWADIDAGKKGAPYSNANEALDDLARFVGETKLTPTYIIASGKGLHVYWCFDRNIPADEWIALATAFKDTCDNHSLKVDPARAKDISSVLRCPGTVHQSSGTPVRILSYTEQSWAVDAFSGLLDVKPEVISSMPKPPVAVQSNMQDLMGVGPQVPTAKALPIIQNCAQILTMGYGKYPQWFAAMSVLRRCVDGNFWAHKLSAFNSDIYEYNDTERRFNEALADSPCLCSTFEAFNPSVCLKCRHRNTVKTPVQLKHMPVQASQRHTNLGPAFVPQEKGDGPLNLAFPEKYEYARTVINSTRFRVDSRGIVHIALSKDKEGNFTEEENVICTTQLYYKYGVVTRDTENDGRPSRSYIFEAVYPNGKTEDLTFIVEKDLNSFGIMRWFANANMYPTSAAYTEKHFMNFMNAYLDSVVHNAAELKSYEQFGWTAIVNEVTKETKPGFVTGSGVITEDGLTHAAFATKTQPFAVRDYSHAGSLVNWKYVPQMYRILGQPLGQLVMCMSFASPLMKYGSGEAKNCILSLYSLKSGKGKTSTLRFAASVWGDPSTQFFTQQESTAARCRKLGVLNNLPAFMDEITNATDEEMADLAYILISGLEKHKLRSSGAEFVKTGDWSTCVFSTSNKSYKAALTKQYGMTDARLLRVMEFECSFADDPRYRTPQVQEYVDKCKSLCTENYGIAGPQFLYNLLQKPERLETLTLKMERWVRDNGFAPEERFMAFPLALAIQAGRWAVEFDLLDYDMDELERWVLNVFVSANRRATEAFKLDALAVMTDYLNSRIMSTLVVKHENRPIDMPDPGNPTLPDKYLVFRPTREVAVRYEQSSQRITFSQYDFNSWCRLEHLQPKAVLELLEAKNITIHKVRVDLSKNISWLALPRTYCYRIEGPGVKKLGYIPPEQSSIQEVNNE